MNHISTLRLGFSFEGKPKLAVLNSTENENIYFVVDDNNLYVFDRETLLEHRKGHHQMFTNEKQIIISSEEGEDLRIAIYRPDNCTNPPKFKLQISKYIPLPTFKHSVNFIDVISQRIIINILRQNTFNDKEESVIIIYRIQQGFKLKYDHLIITHPIYFGEVCMDTNPNRKFEPLEFQGYDLEPYEDCLAAFSRMRVYRDSQNLIYRRKGEHKTHYKKCEGEIFDLETMEWKGTALSYIEKLEGVTFLKFIYADQTYESMLFDDITLISKYTSKDIYVLGFCNEAYHIFRWSV